MVVKTEVCSYSGFRIYPGHGIKYVRGDSKSFLFINRKSKSYFHQKFNPRKIAWTLLYRRMHKKGTLEDTQKKTKRKVSKGAPKAVVGASLELIKQKRNQKPEVRAAAREAALREIKEREKAKQVGPPPSRRLVQCTVHRRMRSGALHTRACMNACEHEVRPPGTVPQPCHAAARAWSVGPMAHTALTIRRRRRRRRL